MSDDKTQPMITVKKSDGTTIKMSLAEFKKMSAAVKGGQASGSALGGKADPVVSVAPKAAVENKGGETSVIARSEERATKQSPGLRSSDIKGIATLLPMVARDDNKKTPPPSSDFKPLVEEMPLTVNKAAPLASASRADQAEKIIKKLSFKVSPDNQNRLRAIIQLRLKDIRTAEETKETASRKVGDGGLGVTEVQAVELARLCDEEIAGKSTENKDSISDIRKLKGEETPRHDVGTSVPVANKSALPATTTPFNAFVHGEKTTPPSPPPKGGGNSSSAFQKEIGTPFKLNSQSAVKATMHDIIPKAVEMGPVDEIRSATLTDFRRLAAKPEEAAHRFFQKFINLKEESILLYLEAASAWRMSSLYLEYIGALGSALARQQKFAPLITDKNSIQLNEIKAIIEMDKNLSL